MTIRDQLKSQMFKARAVAFGCWLVLAGCLFFFKNSINPAWFSIPFIGFAGSVLYILFFVKCPMCGARLGQVLSSMHKPDFCPGCGVNFDSRA
ncbi:MAG: hypothetical protein E6Q88_01030 [Lysobacteraceae bacterium]|nr:MAG: hypothetical protein E6Q88_01030 [Xanthomonadaceae bacterium]